MENRESYFGDLFLKIDLDKISTSFLNAEISSSDLVLENAATSKKLVQEMRKRMNQNEPNQNDRENFTSYLSVTPQTSKKSRPSVAKQVQFDNLSPKEKSETSQNKPARKSSWSGEISLPNQSSNSNKNNIDLTNLEDFLADWESSTSSYGFSSIPPPRSFPEKKNVSSKYQSFEFILLGGKTSPSYVRKFNVNTKQWKKLPEFVETNSCDGKLLCFRKTLCHFGGRFSDCLNSVEDVWSLNLKNPTHSWISCSNMNQKRHRFGCAVFNKEIWVARGRAHKTESLDSVESFHPSNNSWTERPDMRMKRIGCCLVEYKNTLCVIGGVTLEKDSYLRQVETFAGKSWKGGLQMQHKRSDFAAVVLNDKIYAIGGKAGDKWYNNSVECFCDGEWMLVAQLNSPRSLHSACVVGNKIYVVGGENHKGPVRTLEVYYPEENRWEISDTIKGDAEDVLMASI